MRSITAVWVLAASVCLAVPVEKWVQTTRSDFEAGKAEGVAVLGRGQLALAPALEKLQAPALPHIWSLAASRDGTLYAASGTDATLLRLRRGKAEVFFKAPEKSDIELLAVAVGKDGAVYASAAPSGTIYKITKDGKAKVFFKAGMPYVWALAVADDGTVFAATGPGGKVLKISPRGKATELVRANAKHVLCLALAPDGMLYAGTDTRGLVYEINQAGEVRVAYQAAESEIRAMTLAPDGTLYFATAATKTPAKRTTSQTRTYTIGGRTFTIRAPSSASSRSSSQKPSAPGTKVNATNTIYSLDPRGRVATVASLQGGLFFSLAWHQGHLYAGTGNEGKLYRVEDHQPVMLADTPESQITALAATPDSLFLATANSGRIYRLGGHRHQGVFTSEVYDTGSISRWGTISWQAHTPPGTSVVLATRSGNVKPPDETWSKWSAPCTRAQGTRITSPPARYIQYRATLKSKGDASPVLDEVAIAYAESNRAPVVRKITLTKPPKPRRPSIPTQPGQPRTPRPTTPPRSVNSKKQPATPQRGPFADTLRIIWQATDPNKDQLTYSVYFRGEDETRWKLLRRDLTTTYYDWDTHAVPDGPYRIRVVASDARTNPPDAALEGQRTTEAFLVDNTPPTVSDLAVKVNRDRSVRVTARCTDPGAGLASGEYSIDGGKWTGLSAQDGLFDSASERLEFTTRPLERGEHTIVVRVKDEAENSGAAKIVFVIE